MNQQTKSYGSIELFKYVAAILVIAIHTSPLEGVTQTGDFILTRIVARVAVPFFIMITGYFVLPGCAREGSKLKRTLIKLGLLYGVATVLYLPFNIYKGYFGEKQWGITLVKDILVDGTFYHLWYLPGVMLGLLLIVWLLRRLGTRAAAAVSLGLYVIGLFGDSYYGAVEGSMVGTWFYEPMFHLFSYTRNGLFFVPVFLMLGYWLQEKTEKTAQRLTERQQMARRTIKLVGFLLSFGGLMAEGLVLHLYGWQRHDSMYVLLLPCMFFLFSLLLEAGKKEKKEGWQLPRTDIPMFIYLLHPACIVVVRLIAKVLKWEALAENNLVHFVAVLIMSSLAAGLAEWLCRRSSKHE